jgi:GntR family transcriptional regulator, transcriptional repressor for pyruvate dehydrogenase complex
MPPALSDKQIMSVNRTQVLKRETLAERLLIQLRRQILSGALAPGQRIPSEQDISLAFGVGRTTVREALGGLVASGFATRQRHRLVVTDHALLGAEDVNMATLAARISVRDVYETRKLFEVKAVELAAEHWNGDDLLAIRDILDDMRTAEVTAFHEADVSFHVTLVRLSKNAALIESFERSRDLFFKLPNYWRVFSQPSRRARQRDALHGAKFEHYDRVLKAVEARDPIAAGQAMFDHLTAVERDLITHLESPEVEVAGDGRLAPTASPS